MVRIKRLTNRFRLLRRRKDLKKIRLIVCDVDGVLTDGGLYYGAGTAVAKKFNVRDGMAINMLRDIDVEVAFLSGGDGRAVNSRARDLGIEECYTKVADKAEGLKMLREKLKVKVGETAFLGDDINDLVTREECSLLVATADASNQMYRQADWVLTTAGGSGALRELAELLIKSRQKIL